MVLPFALLCLHCFGSDLSGAFLVLCQFCNTSSSLQSCPSPAWCSRCCGWCILEGKTLREGGNKLKITARSAVRLTEVGHEVSGLLEEATRSRLSINNIGDVISL